MLVSVDTCCSPVWSMRGSFLSSYSTGQKRTTMVNLPGTGRCRTGLQYREPKVNNDGNDLPYSPVCTRANVQDAPQLQMEKCTPYRDKHSHRTSATCLTLALKFGIKRGVSYG